jgi:uncharacterized membrane protein YdjX (TVP38/TMEM64 family)
VSKTDLPVSNRATSLQVLLLLIFSSLVIVLILSNEVDRVRAYIQASGWFGAFVTILLYGVLGASPVPSEPLTVLNSTISGPFIATLVATLGNTLAALVEYYIGLKVSDVTRFDQHREKLPFGLGRIPVHSPAFLLLARNLPGYGPKFVSLLAGAYRVPIWRFIWTTLVVNLIGAAIFAYGGFGIIKELTQ